MFAIYVTWNVYSIEKANSEMNDCFGMCCVHTSIVSQFSTVSNGKLKVIHRAKESDTAQERWNVAEMYQKNITHTANGVLISSGHFVGFHNRNSIRIGDVASQRDELSPKFMNKYWKIYARTNAMIKYQKHESWTELASMADFIHVYAIHIYRCQLVKLCFHAVVSGNGRASVQKWYFRNGKLALH